MRWPLVGENFQIYILLTLLENAFVKLFLPLLQDLIISPPLMHNNPSWICPKNFVPTMKRFPYFMGETLGLWCMQVDVHNTLFSCVMFEENDMSFMNPCDNEIMQHNYGNMQKKIVWKWILFCLDFNIATQQNKVACFEKTFP